MCVLILNLEGLPEFPLLLWIIKAEENKGVRWHLLGARWNNGIQTRAARLVWGTSVAQSEKQNGWESGFLYPIQVTPQIQPRT